MIPSNKNKTSLCNGIPHLATERKKCVKFTLYKQREGFTDKIEILNGENKATTKVLA